MILVNLLRFSDSGYVLIHVKRVELKADGQSQYNPERLKSDSCASQRRRDR